LGLCKKEFQLLWAENVQTENLKILIAAGGTGGHLFPAISIAEQIRQREPSVEFLFVGAKGKLEERAVPEHGYSFRSIWISGFARGFRAKNILVPLKILVAVMQSIALIRNFKPDTVVGTGGFVTGPVLYAASLLHVPTLIQEQNSIPGFTTRRLARRVNEVHVGFEATIRFLKSAANVKVSGNPTRETLGTVERAKGVEFFHLDPQKKTLFAFGGSLGASSMNSAVLGFAEELCRKGFQLIWQTGELDYERIKSDLASLSGVRIEKFIEKMEYAYAAADLVVSRAGAITLAELTRVGRAAILVPYPHAAAGHQLLNARALVDAGGAALILDHELVPALKDAAFGLLQDDCRREEMAQRSRSLGKPDAAKTIAEAVLRLARTAA
jgi:UDP-N-acetylglucosamine--N-acetylmuramyl-(pentapeptide) pyrophosphoryl-undecaprenol N-acetylglucosamine transferase